MTRLTSDDIRTISNRLADYDRELVSKTGMTLFGIACHVHGRDHETTVHQAASFSIQVIPNTSGLGIITDFCDTVSAVLTHLGFNSEVSPASDVAGLAHVFKSDADAVMTADDHTFSGLNLTTRAVTDNSRETGRAFAAVLDCMAERGIKGERVLVMGCGSVGEAGARQLIARGAWVGLYDTDMKKAAGLKSRLDAAYDKPDLLVEDTLKTALDRYGYILEATPVAESVPDSWAGAAEAMAAPGVPLGLSGTAARIMKDRLVHDKLELGVAAMAVGLLP